MSLAYWYKVYSKTGLSPQDAYREARAREARESEERAHREAKGYGRFAGKGPEAARYRSIKEIEDANRRIDHHWFDPDTKRFFNSRVLGPVYGGHYFVSSEKDTHGSRGYSVRKATRHGVIETVGKFQGYSTPAQARAAIKRLMKNTKSKRSR